MDVDFVTMWMAILLAIALFWVEAAKWITTGHF